MEERIQNLFRKYFEKTASAEETVEFMDMVQQAKYDDGIKILLQDAWNGLDGRERMLSDDESEKIFKKIIAKPVVKIYPKRIWNKIAVAASIALILGLSVYFLFFNKSGKQIETAKTNVTRDVAAPSIARATLRLDDGRIIYLDSATNGSLASEGNVNVVKLADGQIKYSQESGVASQEVRYNTISNPRGSKVQTLTLIDGTQVWLNAESSITYPTAFINNERKVSINGEAYFEVTHDATKKFIVDANGVTTEVLGTHFNVNAYPDEVDIKVTLLEGAIRIKKENNTNVLKPGQQAQVTNKINVIDNADLEQVMAWKNGLFQFNGADVQTVMKELARWYNLDVSYEGKIPERKFEGKLQRDLNLSDVLDGLSKNQVHYTIEGKKIIVKP